MNNIIVKYPKSMKEELKNNEYLEYIEESKIDMRPIYRLNVPIPKGYEYVNLETKMNVIEQFI